VCVCVTHGSTFSVDYFKSDILNVDKNQLSMTKTVRLVSSRTCFDDTNCERVISSSLMMKTTLPSNDDHKSADRIWKDNDRDEHSLSQQTATMSTSYNISKGINSYSEKVLDSSSREIRPGDRVKNSKHT
jgi:hypothetical protein